MTYGREILVILSSYIIGCISTGYYLTRFFAGKDIRSCGSGSTGARNVGRTLGKKGFIITLCGDFAKGMITMAIVNTLQFPIWAVVLSLLGVVIGHIYPAQLGFRGGKGIAVTLGALLVFDWRLMVALAMLFALCFVLSKKYMLSGMLAIIVLPIMAVLMKHTAMEITGIVILALIILFAHRTNICKLLLPMRATTNVTSSWNNNTHGKG